MNKQINILIFETNDQIGMILKESLFQCEFNVTLINQTTDFLKEFNSKNIDLCLLNIQPCADEIYSIVEKVKNKKESVSILFMGEQPNKEDIRKAFQVGADDFIRKPFSIEELKARIFAILKRTHLIKTKEIQLYQFGNFLFDTHKQTLFINGQENKLTTKETELLKLLCKNANALTERTQALASIWKNDSYFNARSMDVYITKLRSILKSDPRIEIINIHGKGYKLKTHA